MQTVSDTKSAILERAMTLLQTRGFDGFSYKDISEPMGVKNAAIHYHYPSKTDLALAMIEHYQGILRKNTAGFMAYGGSALEQLEGLMCFTRSECSFQVLRGCPQVWESLAHLVDFVRSPAHLAIMRRRREWFSASSLPYLALWWVPAGHEPGVEEARKRLDFLRVNGPSSHAFSFSKPFPAPAAIASSG